MSYNSRNLKISILILTCDRPDILLENLKSLSNISYSPLEIIVVDNGSTPPDDHVLKTTQYIKLDKNYGAVGRNYGIRVATGDIIITIDDDVIGIDDDSIWAILELFQDETVGAVCFKVVDPAGNICNWCHHYKVEDFHDRVFVTDEISEGAVAFKKSVLNTVGLYPESFFISHEGRDLACRIINFGYSILYSPAIVVTHFHEQAARPSWRRYYYDTRNLIWVYVHNYPWLWGSPKVFVGLGAMLVYALRDGFFMYWIKGVIDGIRGIPKELPFRQALSRSALVRLEEIGKNHPGFMYMVKRRISQRNVAI